MIWTLAPLGILAVLVAIDWAAGRREHGPWAYPLCGCLHPDPEHDDPLYLARCKSCGDWFDHWNCQPPRSTT